MEQGQREFYVVVGCDEDGCYVSEVPQLRVCCAQGRSIDEQFAHVCEVVEACLVDEPREEVGEFIGVQRLAA